MNRPLPIILALSATSLLLSTCNESAYYPLQPTVPLVTGARQAEVSASLDQSGFGVARANVAPVNHLLLTGAVSGRFWGPRQLREQRSGERRQQQWELGLGTFTHLGPHTTVGLLGGYGQGTSDSQRFYPSLTFSMAGSNGGKEYRRYETATNRWFGQVHVVADLFPDDPDIQFQLGGAYRLSLVNYQRYSLQSRYYYAGTSTADDPVRYEVPAALWNSLTVNGTLRLKAWPALALQPSLGLAMPFRANPRSGPNNDDYLTEVSHYGRWGQASIGLALYPHLLLRRNTQ